MKKSSCAMKATAPSTAMIAQRLGFPASATGTDSGVAAGPEGSVLGIAFLHIYGILDP
jgi:hypothetical protein